jgi:hypothetical protein
MALNGALLVQGSWAKDVIGCSKATKSERKRDMENIAFFLGRQPQIASDVQIMLALTMDY